MTRTVVTGAGVIAPNALGLRPYWDAVLHARSGIRRIQRFDADSYPCRLAGEVLDFVAKDHLPNRLLPQTDRMTQCALAAAHWALQEANDESITPLSVGVITAASCGGFDFGQRELQNLWSEGPDHVSAYMSFAWFYAVNTGQIAIRHNLRGPVGVIVGEQAGGLDAVAQARRKIRHGAPMMVTGAVDSSLCPYGIAAQITSGRLSTVDEPDQAYLPFDRRSRGHVPGEGGAIFTLEDAERAQRRGAHIHGEIAGYGATFDPPPSSGRPGNLRAAIETALADAGVDAADVGMVFADAAAVPDLDVEEAHALQAVFGPRGVAVTAPKTLTGRLYSGAGPLDLVTAMTALSEGVIPATAHVRNIDDDLELDLVTDTPRCTSSTLALVLARGFGGFNSAMVVRRAASGHR
jgi:act minimal PKS chain-length factor (CLF/KS beta)